MDCGSEIEPLGKSEGAKEAPSRSIKQFFKLFKFEKLGRQWGEKTFSTRCKTPGAFRKALGVFCLTGYREAA